MRTDVLYGPDLGWSRSRGQLDLRDRGAIVDLGPAHRVSRRRPQGLGRILLVAGVVASVGWAALAGLGTGAAPAAADTVVVQSGNSVWSIAASHYPGDDLRARVAEILAVNHLSSATIQPGETLVLPAS